MEYYEAQGDGIVSPLGLLDILPDVTDGHSGFFMQPMICSHSRSVS